MSLVRMIKVVTTTIVSSKDLHDIVFTRCVDELVICLVVFMFIMSLARIDVDDRNGPRGRSKSQSKSQSNKSKS